MIPKIGVLSFIYLVSFTFMSISQFCPRLAAIWKRIAPKVLKISPLIKVGLVGSKLQAFLTQWHAWLWQAVLSNITQRKKWVLMERKKMLILLICYLVVSCVTTGLVTRWLSKIAPKYWNTVGKFPLKENRYVYIFKGFFALNKQTFHTTFALVSVTHLW